MKMQIWCLLAAGTLLLAQPRQLPAEHFNIVLEASGPDKVTTRSFADDSPPEGGHNVRPVLRAHPGDPITVQFIMTNVFPHQTSKDAGVRYYVVKEKERGEKTLPEIVPGVAPQGTFNLDLKPQARVGARFHFVIDEPGVYLLRVESLRTQNTHEHFSAIDLEIR